MFSRFSKLIAFAVLLSGTALVGFSQTELPDASERTSRPRRDEPPLGLREMLAKQRVERNRKDHEELIERGNEALRLAKQLEVSFAQNKGFSQQDKSRLESLEKVVGKIRKELGGDDDDDERGGVGMTEAADEPRPSTFEEAFRYLEKTTVRLVDELKKTTRFSVSVVAIQSSNTVLRLVRFLRLKK